jgi:hypothetical protein
LAKWWTWYVISFSLSCATDISQDAARLKAFSKRMADFFGRAGSMLHSSMNTRG